MTKPEYDRLDTLYEQLDSPIGLERRMTKKTTHNGPDAIGSMTEFDVQRVEKEMQRPDDEVTKKRIEFLKLFDPDFKPKKEA